MSTLVHILKYKFISFVKTTFDFRFSSVIRGVGSLLVFGGFSLSAYFLSHEITKFILDQTRTGLFLYHRFLSMLLFVFFVAVNLGNIIVSYATLYKSPEVGYLLTKPVSFTNIFVLKFLDNFLYSSTTLFLVAFMVLLGYGSYFGYPWYVFLGVMLFVLVPFMFLSACIAVLILLSLIKIAARWGFRKVMLGLSLLYFSLVFFFFKFSNPIRLVEEINRYYPNVDQYFAQFDAGFVKYLPNNWLADFLFFMARGEPATALPFAGLLLAVTLGFFVICLIVADRFYYRSWLVTFEFQAQSNTVERSQRVRWFDFRKESLLPSQTESLLKKEYFQFVREPSQWIHLLVMVVLVSVFVMSLNNLNLRARVTDVQTMTYLVLFAFGGFLASSLTLRFVFPMVSLEGKPFWSLRSSPLDLRRLYFLKFALAIVLVMSLALVVAISSNEPFVRFTERRPLLLWFGIYSAIWISLTLVSLNLGFGGYFSNFQEKNPIRVASSQGATLTFLISLIYLITLVAVSIVPLSNYFASLFVFAPFDFRSIVMPGTVIAVVSASLISFAVVVGIRALQRDF